MRLLVAIAAAGLLASAYFAPRHYAARTPDFPLGRFVTVDARQRFREGDAGRQLGVAMTACDDLLRERPGDPGFLRDRIRTAFVLCSVGLDQPKMEQTVWEQANAYLERRAEIDPDGTFLEGVVRRWIDERLRYDWTRSVYPRAAIAMFLAARGDASAREALLDLARRGMFHLQFLPFVRRYHPGWLAVEPLVTYYLEQGELAARVEAGVTLLDYNTLFGVGGELVERHLPAIRASVREMRGRMRALAEEPSDAGRAALMGTALLALRGDEDEKRALVAAKSERELLFYAPFADVLRVGRMCAGLDPFSSMAPTTVRFKELDTPDQELYYVAAAWRAAWLKREGGAGGEGGDLADLIEAAFDGGLPASRVLSMQALVRLDPERGKALVGRALEARSAVSVYAGILSPQVEDRVALFLPAMASKEPDLSAVAAASVYDKGEPPAIQR